MKPETAVSVISLCVLGFLPTWLLGAAETDDADLIFVSNGTTNAKIIVSPSPGPWEARAAEDPPLLPPGEYSGL